MPHVPSPYYPTGDAAIHQRAMVFIDGTNLFYRLASAKLKLLSLSQVLKNFIGSRQIVRVYLYTSEPHYKKAVGIHGDSIVNGVRVVFGEAIPAPGGNFKEKGVDALLVADLVYHAAAKNCEYALVVSTDQDFAHALERVEDFGCRTAVLSFCSELPALLQQAADDVFIAERSDLLQWGWAEENAA